ncbi:CFC_HP_G0071110.mRNA.1.CDS.1 [Saccharomyces cerevisiae]|nr:CFC_HP_G0071110.mRNA.1.CDS.1 [Saccharomyces cerevisiae]CAI6674673.1 CFC_HP_G0071110.mRNA.1.CDS.1 [Saccharomyces cerevisiae]
MELFMHERTADSSRADISSIHYNSVYYTITITPSKAESLLTKKRARVLSFPEVPFTILRGTQTITMVQACDVT